jgi:hypothetical protein
MFMSGFSSRRDNARLDDDDLQRDAGRRADGDAALHDYWCAAGENSCGADDPLRGHAWAAGVRRQRASGDDVGGGECRDGLSADEHARERGGRCSLTAV